MEPYTVLSGMNCSLLGLCQYCLEWDGDWVENLEITL